MEAAEQVADQKMVGGEAVFLFEFGSVLFLSSSYYALKGFRS